MSPRYGIPKAAQVRTGGLPYRTLRYGTPLAGPRLHSTVPRYGTESRPLIFRHSYRATVPYRGTVRRKRRHVDSVPYHASKCRPIEPRTPRGQCPDANRWPNHPADQIATAPPIITVQDRRSDRAGTASRQRRQPVRQSPTETYQRRQLTHTGRRPDNLQPSAISQNRVSAPPAPDAGGAGAPRRPSTPPTPSRSPRTRRTGSPAPVRPAPRCRAPAGSSA